VDLSARIEDQLRGSDGGMYVDELMQLFGVTEPEVDDAVAGIDGAHLNDVTELTASAGGERRWVSYGAADDARR
jgi:hypothetical protein